MRMDTSNQELKTKLSTNEALSLQLEEKLSKTSGELLDIKLQFGNAVKSLSEKHNGFEVRGK